MATGPLATKGRNTRGSIHGYRCPNRDRIYTCSIARDITDRKRKEAALRGALTEIQELRERLEAENNYLQEEIKLNHNFGEIVSENRGMQKVLLEVEQGCVQV